MAADDLLFYRDGELRQGPSKRSVARCSRPSPAEPEESLKQADIDEWAAALQHHFAVACPVLKPDDV